MKVREVIRLLEQDGWQLTASAAATASTRHPAKPGKVTVAGKPSTDVPPGTLGNIFKRAGLRGQ